MLELKSSQIYLLKSEGDVDIVKVRERFLRKYGKKLFRVKRNDITWTLVPLTRKRATQRGKDEGKIKTTCTFVCNFFER